MAYPKPQNNPDAPTLAVLSMPYVALGDAEKIVSLACLYLIAVTEEHCYRQQVPILQRCCHQSSLPPSATAVYK
jgi:hypothetical protein